MSENTQQLSKVQINATKLIKIQPPNRDDVLYYEYFSSNSEQVVKFIIEKLISLAISEDFVQNLSAKIPDECYQFTKATLNTYINSQYIAYDRDEAKPKQKDLIEDESAFNIDDNNSESHPIIKPETSNALNTLNMSSRSSHFDLNAIFFNNSYRGDNVWDIVDEPGSNEIDRYASSMISYTKTAQPATPSSSSLNKIEEEPNTLPLPTPLIKKLKEQSLKTLIPSSLGFSQEGVVKKKKNLEAMNEFSFHDITIEENAEQIKYDKEVEELRKEKENENKKIETEKKKMVQIEKEVQSKIKEEQTKYKEFEKKKVTVDANGKIVFIKSIRPEILAKDFITIRSIMKNVSTGDNLKKSPRKKKETIERNEQGDVKQQQDSVKSHLPVIESAKKRTSVAPVKKLNIESNLPVKEANPSLSILERKKERGPIMPSGSCFDLISLEVGVNITEDKKYKTGGKDFFKKFNKYSLDSYNRQLKDTISSNMSMINTNPVFTSANILTNTDYNYQTNLTEPNQTMTSKKPLFQQTMFRTSKLTSLNNSIKMSNNGFSLSSAMEGLDLLASRLEKSDRANQKNIFKEKNRTNNSMNTKELKEMNKFAVTLMSDNWGSELRGNKTRLNLGKTAFKPAMKEIAKEIGSIKQLPRVRGIKMMNTMTLLNRKKN